jgi:hypothetical protein
MLKIRDMRYYLTFQMQNPHRKSKLNRIIPFGTEWFDFTGFTETSLTSFMHDRPFELLITSEDASSLGELKSIT